MTRAGFGRAVITPPLPVALAGFSGRSGPATEVLDDLEVQAVWLENEGASVCLLVCDLLGMSPGVSAPVRAAVAAALAIPVEAVLTSCIHTHAGPNCIEGGERLGWPTPDGYLAMLAARVVDAAVEARGASEGAELRFARAPLPVGVSHNRRGNAHEPTFALLDVRSLRGDRLGTVANVAIHPVALGSDLLAVSADWVGAFRRALEAAVGGRAVLLSGALGDVNPREAQPGADAATLVAHAGAIGAEVAHAVAHALDGAAPIGDGVHVTRAESFDVPVSGTLADLVDLGDAMTVELVEWRIGDTAIVSVPGEAFHALGRAIEASHGDRLLLAGLAPSWQGYLPDPFGVGYEEMVSFGQPAVAGIKDRLLAGHGAPAHAHPHPHQ
jgi:neutral ceramidase